MKFSKKQKGYGRQGLYFDFNGETYHVIDVFPNVDEHFNITHDNNAFYDDDEDVYNDCNGNELNGVYSDKDEWLFNNLKQEIGQVLY